MRSRFALAKVLTPRQRGEFSLVLTGRKHHSISVLFFLVTGSVFEFLISRHLRINILHHRCICSHPSPLTSIESLIQTTLAATLFIRVFVVHSSIWQGHIQSALGLLVHMMERYFESHAPVHHHLFGWHSTHCLQLKFD